MVRSRCCSQSTSDEVRTVLLKSALEHNILDMHDLDKFGSYLNKIIN